MIVYATLIVLVVVLAFFLKPYHENHRINRSIYIASVGVLLCLVSGLRHISIGADTESYIYGFMTVGSQSWDALIKNFIAIYFQGVTGQRDPGYTLFVKLIHSISTDSTVYLLIVAAIFTIPLCWWVYKNSRYPCISFVLYITLFFSFFGITGIRQTLATAICVFVGYKFVKERKLIPFTTIVLLSATLHRSALIFLIFYFVANIELTKKYIVVVLCTMPIMFVFRYNIFNFLKSDTVYDYYSTMEASITWTFTLSIILVIGYSLLQRKIILSNNPYANHYINAGIISIALTPLTFINPSTMRVVQYFSIFLMLLLPEIVAIFSTRDRKFIYSFVIISLSFLFLRRSPQYLFFWQ